MKTLIFSGHMIDGPDKKTPRFPPSKEKLIRKAILETLETTKNLFPEMEGIAGGACGGDILFHEACLHSRIPTQMILPFSPDQFLKTSVAFAGYAWVQRFKQLLTTIPYEVLNKKQAADSNIWDETNRHMISFASANSYKNVMLLALWDMVEENHPGGTYAMIQLAKEKGIIVQLLNTKNF